MSLLFGFLLFQSVNMMSKSSINFFRYKSTIFIINFIHLFYSILFKYINIFCQGERMGGGGRVSQPHIFVNKWLSETKKSHLDFIIFCPLIFLKRHFAPLSIFFSTAKLNKKKFQDLYSNNRKCLKCTHAQGWRDRYDE